MNTRTALSSLIDNAARLLGKVSLLVGGVDVSTSNPVPISSTTRLFTGADAFAYMKLAAKSDTVDIPSGPARGLRIIDITSGAVVIYDAYGPDGVRYTFTETVVAGQTIPVAAYRVRASTTATVAAGW